MISAYEPFFGAALDAGVVGVPLDAVVEVGRGVVWGFVTLLALFIGFDERTLGLLALPKGFDAADVCLSSGRDACAGLDGGTRVRGVFGASFRIWSSALRLGNVFSRGRDCFGAGLEGCPLIWARRSLIGIFTRVGRETKEVEGSPSHSNEIYPCCVWKRRRATQSQSQCGQAFRPVSGPTATADAGGF